MKTFAQLDDFLYATVNIAIWSNIETGLGISAGSLATLRPLLRKFMKAGTSYDKSTGARLPLGSLDSDLQRRLRPDKLAVTVTTVQSQAQPERSSYDRISHELDQHHPPLPGIIEESGIHRTVEVTQTESTYSVHSADRMA